MDVARAPGIAFVMELATALHRFGTPAHRLESTMAAVARQIGLEAHFLSMPTAILVGVGPPEAQATMMVRVDPGTVDLGKLAALDRIADRVGRGECGAAIGSDEVRAVVAAKAPYSPLVRVVASGVLSLCIARFLGGGEHELAIAGAIGLVVGLLGLLSSRVPSGSHVVDLVSAFVAGAIAHGASAAGYELAVRIAVLAGIISLIPGLTMTIAMNEVATRNLVSGTARLMAAAMVFLEITIGMALADRVMTSLVGPALAGTIVPLPAYTELVALPLVALALVVELRARPHQLVIVLVAAVAAYYSARLGAWLLDAQLGAVLGSFLVAVGANVYGRVAGRPAMVPLVPGLLLLVPGSLGMRSLSSLLERDVVTGIDTAFAMVMIAVSLVAGMLLANATVSPRRNL
jgi:uncharacterized membrane protein YjjP (DUF1212 family)